MAAVALSPKRGNIVVDGTVFCLVRKRTPRPMLIIASNFAEYTAISLRASRSPGEIVTSWPYSRSCRTASIRCGRAGGFRIQL
jgi:hypothetical protein